MAAGFLCVNAHAQNQPKTFKQAISQPCGTAEYQQQLEQKSPKLSAQQFESWISKKIEEKKAARSANDASDDQTYNIPVVIHVMHNGDPEGVNENISETQILSELQVLQQDYNRMVNTPGYNDNPVGATINVNFCLAKRTPDGQNTTGIVRHYSDHTGGWSQTDANEILKPSTQWDPEQYLNIWIVDWVYIASGPYKVELAGFSTFPMQSGLEGIDNVTQTIADQDGVVIGHNYFGSREIFPEGIYDETRTRDKGRTATHEIGHYFGLRHIWGDGWCNVDDFCEDTPVTGQANMACIEGTDTCPDSPGLDMLENYMDYTPEGCQNIFTQDQKNRIVTVLENSPRRVNLLTSEACNPAFVYENDAALYIEQINLTPCTNAYAPQLKLVNNGTSPLTSATIAYNTSGENSGTYEWTGNLAPQESATITLPEQSSSTGVKAFNVTLTEVNGTTDAYAENNTKGTGFRIFNNVTTANVVFTLQRDRRGAETTWTIYNSSHNVVASGGPYNTVASSQPLPAPVVTTIPLQPGECYTFMIIDTKANGICCAYGDGYYNLADENGNVFASGGEFNMLYDLAYFGASMTLDTENPQAIAKTEVVLYPNPANSVINIASPKNSTLADAYVVYNNLGQVVAQGKVASYNQEVNISALTNGVYFIKLNNNNQALRFVKY